MLKSFWDSGDILAPPRPSPAAAQGTRRSRGAAAATLGTRGGARGRAAELAACSRGSGPGAGGRAAPRHCRAFPGRGPSGESATPRAPLPGPLRTAGAQGRAAAPGPPSRRLTPRGSRGRSADRAAAPAGKGSPGGGPRTSTARARARGPRPSQGPSRAVGRGSEAAGVADSDGGRTTAQTQAGLRPRPGAAWSSSTGLSNRRGPFKDRLPFLQPECPGPVSPADRAFRGLSNCPQVPLPLPPAVTARFSARPPSSALAHRARVGHAAATLRSGRGEPIRGFISGWRGRHFVRRDINGRWGRPPAQLLLRCAQLRS